jgi:hypothetical protein
LIGASGRPRLQPADCISVPDDETVTRGVADPRPNRRSGDRGHGAYGDAIAVSAALAAARPAYSVTATTVRNSRGDARARHWAAMARRCPRPTTLRLRGRTRYKRRRWLSPCRWHRGASSGSSQPTLAGQLESHRAAPRRRLARKQSIRSHVQPPDGSPRPRTQCQAGRPRRR